MRTSEFKGTFKTDVKTVWNVITNNSDYTWRSDIDHIEVLEDGKTFIEYARGGGKTKFVITKKKEFSRYEFDMENKMFSGNWTGVFSEIGNGGTEIICTENIHIKNPFMRFLSYFLWDFKKMQRTYIDDLKRKLGE